MIWSADCKSKQNCRIYNFARCESNCFVNCPWVTSLIPTYGLGNRYTILEIWNKVDFFYHFTLSIFQESRHVTYFHYFAHWGKKPIFIQKFPWFWSFRNVNFVKNEVSKMWILWEMRFQKCEFCEKWGFRNVNFLKN